MDKLCTYVVVLDQMEKPKNHVLISKYTMYL